jgi:CBS domain-containing protein
MAELKVKDLMVPLGDYAVVSPEATLQEAVKALEKAQESYDQHHYKHRVILVRDDQTGRIVGRISIWAVLKSLETKYQALVEHPKLSRFGFSPKYTDPMFKTGRLLETPLEDLGKLASALKAKDLMQTLENDEYVNQEDSLALATHVFVMGRHQALLVNSGDQVVGILRLSDVFKEICNRILKDES